MKNPLKKFLCTIVLSTMFAEIPIGALAYTGLGEIYDIKRDTVGDGLKYTEFHSIDLNGKNQQSYIFEYSPRGGTLPLVRWGDYVYGKDRVGKLVSAAKDDGNTVLGAINGDFFSMQTGVPMGVMIDSGRLISSDDSKYALGFKEDGSAIIGKPSVSITVTNITGDGEALKINQLNKYPSKWGVYMLTEDFGETTHSTETSREIVVQMSDVLTAEGTVYGIVEDIAEGMTDTEIPQGCAVISIAEAYTEYHSFDGISVGDILQFDTTCAEGWNDVVTAIGGGDIILQDGIMPENVIDEDHEKTSHPRTAVGIKDDGNVIFFAVDGRISASRGLKLTELSSVMSELGCVTALNLDGGGSTTVMVKASDSPDCVYINSPADTSYRALSNAILFMSKHESDGIPAALSVTPNTPYVLAGSTVYFSAQILDSAYMPTNMWLDGELLDVSFAEEYEDGAGTFAQNSFTAGNIPGEYALTVSTVVSENKISGDVSVTIVDNPDSLTFTASAKKIRPGTFVKINREARLGNKILLCDTGSFSYTLNGEQNIPNPESYPGAMLVCELGYLDFDGNFQSFGGAPYKGTVEIGISYGDFSECITLEIGDFSEVIADFEDETQSEKFTVQSDIAAVKLQPHESGYKSDSALEIAYSYTGGEENGTAVLKLETPVKIGKDAKSIKLWVSGDESILPSATLLDSDGNTYTAEYSVTKNYTVPLGWRELTAEIPDELNERELVLDSLLVFDIVPESVGTLLIDNAIIHYGSPEKYAISGFEGHWAESGILALYEVYALEDNDCEVTEDGTLIYSPDISLTRGEFAKILTRRLGIDTSPYISEGISCEEDTPEDKLPYIRAVIEAGLMNGRGTLEDGTVIFDANATITREEACKVLGIILPETEAVEIAFSDADSISAWAVDGIISCIDAGIIKGFTDGTVRPRSNISRAEFAVMLGRLK